jgi:hypothetical protein
MRLRRLLGIVLMPAGLVLIVASGCTTILAIADYFAIEQLWGATCPDALRTKALLIAGVVIAVLGQRLFSGRNLRTGAKPEQAD